MDTALERDMDLLIIEEFVSDPDFAGIFLDAASLHGNYTVEKVIHSKTDSQYGESDIVIILDMNSKRQAIHIEDKINAPAMPEQHDRYILRGNKDIKNNEYDAFSLIIAAPEKYLTANAEAKKYKNHVTYETLLKYFRNKKDRRSEYKAALIERALYVQRSSHNVSEVPEVKAFHEKLREYQREHYPELPEGSTAWWSYFSTGNPNVSMVYKANHGNCDLQFRDCLQADLYKRVKNYITPEMTVVQAGKSASVRISVPVVNIAEPFEDNEEDVDYALCQLRKLLKLFRELPPEE